MKTISGKVNNFKGMQLGIVTKKKKLFRKHYIYVNETNTKKIYRGYSGVISNKVLSIKQPYIEVPNKENFDSLHEGDIITVESNGIIKIVWDSEAIDNCLMLTEQCNCNCLMCPQPPKEQSKKDSENIFNFNKRIILLLDPKKINGICITGGEPTLLGDKFIEIVKLIKNKFPKVHLSILTNGKKFRDFFFTKSIAEIGLKNLLFCVSIHGDTSQLHDEIVRVKNSFNETVLGIRNLAKFRQCIELRFVINKLNYMRMKSFSDFVYKNFPFVVHVTFMAQEISGYAKTNFKKIWIDPAEYQNELTSSVRYLHQRGINVSIYNIPLCLLPLKAWHFARQSISEWKNVYLQLCEKCIKKSECCGVFSTSFFQSNNIKPFLQKS